MTPKLKLYVHLTRSPMRDNIYKLCLYVLEEHNTITCSEAEKECLCSKIQTSPTSDRITQY